MHATALLCSRRDCWKPLTSRPRFKFDNRMIQVSTIRPILYATQGDEGRVRPVLTSIVVHASFSLAPYRPPSPLSATSTHEHGQTGQIRRHGFPQVRAACLIKPRQNTPLFAVIDCERERACSPLLQPRVSLDHTRSEGCLRHRLYSGLSSSRD